jgi:hypothetical protein
MIGQIYRKRVSFGVHLGKRNSDVRQPVEVIDGDMSVFALFRGVGAENLGLALAERIIVLCRNDDSTY